MRKQGINISLHIHLFNYVPKYILTNLIIFLHYKINKVCITIHTRFKRYKNTINNDNWFFKSLHHGNGIRWCFEPTKFSYSVRTHTHLLKTYRKILQFRPYFSIYGPYFCFWALKWFISELMVLVGTKQCYFMYHLSYIR